MSYQRATVLNPLSYPAKVRGDLRISQEEAALRLGISKNTWIRWEKGEPYDKAAVTLLSRLVEKRRPAPCTVMQNTKNFTWDVFDKHLLGCAECQLVVEYLAAVTKKKKKLVK